MKAMVKLKMDYQMVQLLTHTLTEIILLVITKRVKEQVMEFINGLMAKFMMVNRNLLILGDYKDNKKEGFGIYLYPNGNYMLGIFIEILLIKGNWNNDFAHGYIIQYVKRIDKVKFCKIIQKNKMQNKLSPNINKKQTLI